jgi:hypothetical protein
VSLYDDCSPLPWREGIKGRGREVLGCRTDLQRGFEMAHEHSALGPSSLRKNRIDRKLLIEYKIRFI